MHQRLFHESVQAVTRARPRCLRLSHSTLVLTGLSFKTAYFNDLGDLVVDPKSIRRHYLKTWFTIDVSSCFPGNYISYAIGDNGGSNSSKMIRLLRMLRLLKLLRLARINRLLRRYEEEFASLMTTFKLGKLCAVIIIIGHFLSCLFFGIGSYEAEHPAELGRPSSSPPSLSLSLCLSVRVSCARRSGRGRGAPRRLGGPSVP